MTDTDNAELAERIAAFGKVVLFDDDEHSHHLRPSHDGPNSLGRGQPAPAKCPRCHFFIAHDGKGDGCLKQDCYYSKRPSRYSNPPAPAEAQELLETVDLFLNGDGSGIGGRDLIRKLADAIRPNLSAPTPLPTVTPDTSEARDFAKWLVGENYIGPITTRLTEMYLWAGDAAVTAANHITALVSQVEALEAENARLRNENLQVGARDVD